MAPVIDGAFVPAPDPQLDQALEYSKLVLELGVAGAPGAAHALAEVVPTLIVEVLAFRAKRGSPAELATREALARIQAKDAERRAFHLGAAGEEMLRQLADERGRVAELKARVAELEELLGPRPVPTAVNPAAEGVGPVLVPASGGAA